MRERGCERVVVEWKCVNILSLRWKSETPEKIGRKDSGVQRHKESKRYTGDERTV